MKLENLIKGLDILKKYSTNFNIVPIPAGFPNGSPNFSTRAYIVIEISFPHEPTLDEKSFLKTLGWREEGEGDYWVLENY